MSRTPRLIIASNRLPFTVHSRDGELQLQPTAGGLAAALGAVHGTMETLWIGWPGDCSSLDPRHRQELAQRLGRERIVPVELSPAEAAAYYDTFCNGVLWPVFHYLIDRVPVENPDWQTYRAINERFAATIAAESRPGDIVWIHDYHLLLAPALVRRRLPGAQIGFFLHTPFPAADVFRVLPWRRDLIEGMLGATLVGFQTTRDVRHFADAVRQLTEYVPEGTSVVADRRMVRFGAHPIGIDVARISDADEAPCGVGRRDIPPAPPGCRLLVGVDRLDYTKGIPRRLTAFERLLTDNPHLCGRVQLVQVAAPSRVHVPSYQSLREQVAVIVARVNARFATADWQPVSYRHEAVSPYELAALYRAADVMLVTSLRDGMNLVAKEFVAARDDADGVLVLSEFAGAAEELPEALLVNPYSIEQLAAAMASALALDPEDRRDRMQALRRRVLGQTVAEWVSRFTHELTRVAAEEVPDPAHLAVILADARVGGELSLVLAYEGALVPETVEPPQPDPELIRLLQIAGGDRSLDIHVVSCRDLDTADAWFEEVPATIWAEYGLWCREAEGRRWRRTRWISAEWTHDLRELLQQFTGSTPGAFLEETPSRLVWHFGRADRVLGRAQAQSLAALLRDAAAAMELDVRERERSIEVRPAALACRAIVERVVDSCAPERRVVVLHGWPNDDEVRQALRPADIAVRVGDGGRTPLPDVRAVRTLLWNLLATPAAATRGHAFGQSLAPTAATPPWRAARHRVARVAQGFSPA